MYVRTITCGTSERRLSMERIRQLLYTCSQVVMQEGIRTCRQTVWCLEGHLKVHGTITPLPKSGRPSKVTDVALQKIDDAGWWNHGQSIGNHLTRSWSFGVVIYRAERASCTRLDTPRHGLLPTHPRREPKETAWLGAGTPRWWISRRYMDQWNLGSNGNPPPLLLQEERSKTALQTPPQTPSKSTCLGSYKLERSYQCLYVWRNNGHWTLLSDFRWIPSAVYTGSLSAKPMIYAGQWSEAYLKARRNFLCWQKDELVAYTTRVNRCKSYRKYVAWIEGL